MVINRSDMKRKRREECPSPFLEESPKRTKVHAQRKFAQGSNVNSPVITPVKEIERQEIDVLPEPVELLPIKRPNTEDFLTFLCFRGTPVLPPSLNFFNTASIVDTNGQVHEIKSESPKNGPIDTSTITKAGSGSSDRPFIAFGVRKRADPIVISRQMDKKRRHALALQALRRKYQEQRMAKIRAVTISKLSEKVSTKTLLRSNSVSKTETVTKKSATVQKTKIIESLKETKVETRSVRAGLRPQIKQKMCLRSFRGRFVQKELQFRNVKKRNLPVKKLAKNGTKKTEREKKGSDASDYSSDDEKPLSKTSVEPQTPKVVLPKIAKKSAPGPKKPVEINFRITRSNKFLNNKIVSRRQQIKQRMIMTTPKTIVKPRTLRSHTAQKGRVLPETKQKILLKSKSQIQNNKKETPLVKKLIKTTPKGETKENTKKEEPVVRKEVATVKKEVTTVKKEVTAVKKEVTTVKKEVTTVKKEVTAVKKEVKTLDNPKKVATKSAEPVKKEVSPTPAANKSKNEKPTNVKKEGENTKKIKTEAKQTSQTSVNKIDPIEAKKDVVAKKKPVVVVKKSTPKALEKKEVSKKEPAKRVEEPDKKPSVIKNNTDQKETVELRTSQRPTRKTKEAAAIYMEILSHKLVNESKIDDDNVSIDSFPELPNVKKTEQRENELKAKAQSTKTSESELSSDPKKPAKSKEKQPDVIECKVLRSSEKKKVNLPKPSEKIVKATDKSEDKKNVKPITNITVESSKEEVTNVEEKVKKPVEETKKAVAKVEAAKEEVCDRKTRSSNQEKSLDKVIVSPVEKIKEAELKVKPNAEKVKEAELKVKPNAEKVKEAELKVKPNAEKVKEAELKVKLNAEKVKEAELKVKLNAEKVKEAELKVKLNAEKVKEAELKVKLNPIDVEDSKKVKTEITEPPKKKGNEKIVEVLSVEFDVSDDEAKNKKPDQKPIKPNDVDVPRRQTRNCSLNIRVVETDDSDESFRADIIIPRKKQITRSKGKSYDSENEESPNSVKKSLRANARSYKECSSSESDHSTTSDVDVIQLKAVTKNKKFTKTRGQQKEEQSFSDSDEEPLSKLTLNKNREVKSEEIVPAKKIEAESETKSKNDKDIKEKLVESEEKESCVKPKRECAKRPQNYLPMFSSSDEDDNYFQGFKMKSENNKPKSTKIPESGCPHIPTSDLSCKDIGRRFGKGKVNMSTEQIEKWLKDSAMAGSSVKNENDAMLKFGEKIPTETSHSVASFIDTEKLKSLLISNVDKQDTDTEKKDTSPKLSEPESVSKQSTATKHTSTMTDRKVIFRNKDKEVVSNVKAFSANNENSVYAFGEEAEDVMKTPFRRPTRRPSSNATSRSEDESSKFEDPPKTCQFRKPPLMKQDSIKSRDSTHVDEAEEKPQTSIEENAFYVPSQPQPNTNKNKTIQKFDKKPIATSMVPPSPSQKPITLKLKPSARSSDVSEEFKYKVPSSPSASSSSSAKLYKRQTAKLKLRATEVLPVKLPDFPIGGACGQLIEAPTFHPTDKEFQDPLEYIEKIRSKAEQFGICRIVPPSTFKPECKVTDDMRFTAYNQYVHKMLHRWGPNFKELMAIKKYLSTQNITLTHPPWIGGMEIDLPRLYQTVQSLGGLKEVIEKKKWPKVSDVMKIPKSAQDRVTKLDDIYCKYLLPYDTLSPAEREKLFDEVETEWAKRESKSLLKAQQDIDTNTTDGESESDDEDEECIVKGRSMALNAFYRIARNTMSMWFKTPEPLPEEVEQEFWKHVTSKQYHICVHSGSIDSGNWGYGFAVSKNSPFARHAWNLKVLTNNSGSVLRSMGPVMGVTVPTLHVGMVFSSCCWYRDPHSLPWIEYLHTGGSKIWYGIPNSTSAAFHAALKTLVPNYCRNKSLWLPSDTVMVPPNILVDYGVSLSRIVQEPGQFIVVFPKVFTSSLSTGYVVSESVYFAPPYWLRTGRSVFDEMRDSCEPSIFSFDRLLLSIVNDARSNVEVLRQIIPAVQELCDKEKSVRDKVKGLGITATEKLPLPEAPQVRKKRKLQNEDGEYECEVCRMNLFVSMVTESQEDAVYCLDHAAELIEQKKIQNKHCTLTFTYDDKELDGLVEKIQSTISNKLQKKVPNRFAGMPTLLTK